MPSPQCLVCGHVNPAGAKFCTDCGSPQIKRCGRCDAFNDPTARNCFKCNAELAESSTTVHATTVPRQNLPPTVSAFSAEAPSLLFDLTDDIRVTPSGAKVNPAAAPSRAGASALATTRSAASRAAGPAAIIENAEAAHASATRSPEGSLSVADEVAQAANTNAQLQHPEAMTELPARSRLTLVVPLSVLAVLATGIFAYYLYNPSLPPDTKHDSAGFRASQGVSPSLGATQVTPIGTPEPATSKESPTATAPVGATSDQLTATQQFDAKTEEAVNKPRVPAPDAGGLRNKTAPSTDGEVSATVSAVDRPVRRYPAVGAAGLTRADPTDGRADVRSDSQRQCTKQVAALGLCSLDQIEERK
jgi:hypothetical protein